MDPLTEGVPQTPNLVGQLAAQKRKQDLQTTHQDGANGEVKGNPAFSQAKVDLLAERS